MILGNMGTFVLVPGKWPWSCSAPNAEFANENKFLPNASVHQPNCLQTKEFPNWGITVSLKIGKWTSPLSLKNSFCDIFVTLSRSFYWEILGKCFLSLGSRETNKAYKHIYFWTIAMWLPFTMTSWKLCVWAFLSSISEKEQVYGAKPHRSSYLHLWGILK